MKKTEVVGKRFGRLVVLEEIHIKKNGRHRYYVVCHCDCGNVTTVEKSKVVSGATRSCGCLQSETRKSLGSRFKKAPGEAAFNETYSAYQKSAKLRGYTFKLSKEQFLEIVVKPCIYCGESLTQTMAGANGSFQYTGIDRYDNSVGYEYENCVPCCKVCNRIKTNMTIGEMSERLHKIIDREEWWGRKT